MDTSVIHGFQNGFFPAEQIVEATKPQDFKQPAVVVKNACKSYSNEKDSCVLQKFCMTVPQGSIYSLLGASGCGKTTVLSCCVGIKRLDSGEISIYGHAPGTNESGVPGKRVGFMPQELSLYPEFTIREALQYFGRIYGMTPLVVDKSMEFLLSLLNLPKPTRRIQTLSGGQKRRVSFAIALIHDPELLILDEPTVGVDPLLRESIWNYLCKLVASGRTTVIITTHYTEEATQSNIVGLMRGGRLLVEKSPQDLLTEFQSPGLESIVLRLCKNDTFQSSESSIENQDEFESSTNPRNPMKPISFALTSWGKKSQVKRKTKEERVVGIGYAPGGNGEMAIPSDTEHVAPQRKFTCLSKMKESFIAFMRRLSALIHKNVIVLTRNLLFLIFVFIVPAIQIVVICLAIGNEATDMNFGVINYEVPGTSLCTASPGCPTTNLSCHYLNSLPSESIRLYSFSNERDAVEQIKQGKIWGYLIFSANYSSALMDRAIQGTFANNQTLDESEILFEMDMSNKNIGQTLQKIFLDTFQTFISKLFTDCGYDSKQGQIPLKFKTPIYGNEDISYREFLAPSVLLGLLFFFPLCSSGINYITEKKTGTLDRSLVAGVSIPEVMLAYLITQTVVLMGQAAFAFIFLTQVFHIEIQGSFIWAVVLAILIGIGGMSMGFLISTFCTEEIQAVLLAIGSFMPNFILAGMVWPVLGMPLSLRYLSYLLPCTLACESMRSIVSRGWGITHPSVWPGFLSTIAWIALYWILAILIHRCSSRN